jgi:prevent-host-death family protein
VYAVVYVSMTYSTADIIPLSEARARLSDLADEVQAGAEKIITRNGVAAVALIDAARLDHYHQLERERYEVQLLDEVTRGLEDVAAGRTADARTVLRRLKRGR